MVNENRPRGAALEVLSDSHNSTANERFRDCYAVLVTGKNVRRHLYLNLPAAERVVKRAHARGDQAELLLVKLVPVAPESRVLRRRAEVDDALMGIDDLMLPAPAEAGGDI